MSEIQDNKGINESANDSLIDSNTSADIEVTDEQDFKFNVPQISQNPSCKDKTKKMMKGLIVKAK